MTSTQELLADRYGRRVGSSKSKNRTRMIVAAAILLVIFVIWAISSITAQQSGISVISSKFSLVTDQHFKVSGVIARPSNGSVTCAVKVQALDFGVVGYREVTLEPNVTSFSTDVFAVQPGVNASVARCWLG